MRKAEFTEYFRTGENLAATIERLEGLLKTVLNISLGKDNEYYITIILEEKVKP